jgi:hypothetical protein
MGPDIDIPKASPLSMWLACDHESCNKWYHDVCVHVSPARWSEINESDESWYCDEHRALHVGHRRSRSGGDDAEYAAVKKVKSD